MSYSTHLSKLACAVALALGCASVAQAAVPVFADTKTLTGEDLQASNTQFTISDAGTYRVSLIDLGFAAPFAFLALGVSEFGGNAVGTPLMGPGSFNFLATTGDYSVNILAAPGQIGSSGLFASSYSANVTLVPEPETWAMMLVGMGLVGWQLRRKVKSSAAGRFV